MRVWRKFPHFRAPRVTVSPNPTLLPVEASDPRFWRYLHAYRTAWSAVVGKRRMADGSLKKHLDIAVILQYICCHWRTIGFNDVPPLFLEYVPDKDAEDSKANSSAFNERRIRISIHSYCLFCLLFPFAPKPTVYDVVQLRAKCARELLSGKRG